MSNVIETVIMPAELTAENGAKYLLNGTFSETVIMQCTECEGQGIIDDGLDSVCEDCSGAGDYAQAVGIEWTTIKEIYAMCVKHLQI